MNNSFFTEYAALFRKLGRDTTFRAIVVSARGKYFSVGLDLKEAEVVPKGSDSAPRDVARTAYAMYNKLLDIQDIVTAMEKCPQPVIFCMHSVCIGGVIDLACGADIRYCSKDAWFCVKEVDIGIAADLGTLQRLGKIVGSQSLVRDLCFTARKMFSEEAKASGFVSEVLDSQEEVIKKGFEVAETIASKSPVAVAGTKVVLNFSRDHTVADSLHFQAAWNASMNQTEDMMKAAMSSLQKGKQPDFSKL